jgi:hypothetical protein
VENDMMKTLFRKDRVLDEIARTKNVAQFVSYDPAHLDNESFCRIIGFEENHRFRSAPKALEALLESSLEKSVNVRSFYPDDPQSKEFIYGLNSVDDAVTAVSRMRGEGLFVIANETIDVTDGGVSGVVQGGIVEFAPDDTPRCVEKPDCASLKLEAGTKILDRVYRFEPDFRIPSTARLEFSLHPKRREWKQTHTIAWEMQEMEEAPLTPRTTWPNRFSRFLGDKVFGLLLADAMGFPVPEATVIHRRVAPFRFGRAADGPETWLRTCPREQVPGKFSTVQGWADPFELLQREDPAHTEIPSLLAQSAVRAAWAGAALTNDRGKSVVEGVAGEGQGFMVGEKPPVPLPAKVRSDVSELGRGLHGQLGACRFEWVHDGREVWLLQLHIGNDFPKGDIVVEGEPRSWRTFHADRGLERLREELKTLSPGEGIEVMGQVGLTSHFADVLRKAGFPARIRTGKMSRGGPLTYRCER